MFVAAPHTPRGIGFVILTALYLVISRSNNQRGFVDLTLPWRCCGPNNQRGFADLTPHGGVADLTPWRCCGSNNQRGFVDLSPPPPLAVLWLSALSDTMTSPAAA